MQRLLAVMHCQARRLPFHLNNRRSREHLRRSKACQQRQSNQSPRVKCFSQMHGNLYLAALLPHHEDENYKPFPFT
jgi:hypothetical protein